MLTLIRCRNCRNLCKRRDDDGTLYDWCGKIVDSPDKDYERDCKYYQVATNGDIVRAMNDEELTKWIVWFAGGSDLHKKLVLNWLKSEVE